MKLIYLKSGLKCDSFDVTIGIKIPFFRVSVTIEPGRSLLQFVTTNCLILNGSVYQSNSRGGNQGSYAGCQCYLGVSNFDKIILLIWLFLLTFELGQGAVINFLPGTANPRNGCVYKHLISWDFSKQDCILLLTV